MAIQISADQRTFTLQTKSSSYQMAVDAYGVLLHLYYGKKIEAENLEYLIYKSDVGFSGNPVETARILWTAFRRNCHPAGSAISGRK